MENAELEWRFDAGTCLSALCSALLSTEPVFNSSNKFSSGRVSWATGRCRNKLIIERCGTKWIVQKCRIRWIIARWRARWVRRGRGGEPDGRRVGRFDLRTVPSCVMPSNAITEADYWFIRHVTDVPFRDSSVRGAFHTTLF